MVIVCASFSLMMVSLNRFLIIVLMIWLLLGFCRVELVVCISIFDVVCFEWMSSSWSVGVIGVDSSL